MSKIIKSLNVEYLTNEVLWRLSEREYADFFKAVFKADIQVFIHMIEGTEIAQTEITIEEGGID